MADGDIAPWHAEFADWPTLAASGWDKLEAPAAAAAIAKSYRDLQKLHGGITSNEVVRLPSEGDVEGAKALWARLGTPADATGYKFENLAFSDGSTPEAGFLDALRGAAAQAQMPAPMLDTFVRAFMPHIEQEENASRTELAAATVTNRAALDQEWGANAMRNNFVAADALQKLQAAMPGLNVTEAISALEGSTGNGYSLVKKLLFGIGSMMGEARYVPGGGQPGALDKTSATEQFETLKRDEGWMRRLSQGDATTLKQMTDLLTIISKG